MEKEKKVMDRTILKNVIIILAGYLVVTVLLKGGFLNRQYTSILVPIGINIILAVSLNLVTGFLGELTLGHAGFMAIGAYTGSLITLNSSLPPAVAFGIAILAGGVLAGVFGLVIGIPVLRLRGDYLAIVTLGFGEIIKSVLNALPFTNGAKGLSRIPTYANYNHYTLVFVFMVITVLLVKNFVNSRDGRAVTAVRDNYIATESIGINVAAYKVKAFVISAVMAGVAGVLYAHNVSIIKPTTFDYNKSIEILVIVVLGGMGSIRGSVIAAILLTALPEMLRGANDYRMLLYSMALIIIMLFNHSKIKEGLMANRTTGKLLKKKEVQ